MTSENSNWQMRDADSRIDTTALEASTETRPTDDTVAEETYELLPSGD